MPRPKKEKKENTGTLGVVNNYAGQFFSLNMKKSSFFGVGENKDGSKKIWLSSSNWFDQAPEGLTELEVNIIANSLKMGTIVIGKRWLPPIDKDKEVKEQYISLIKAGTACNDAFKNKIRTLVRFKAHGNYTAQELLLAMLDQEKAGQSRQVYILFLQDALAHCSGPVSLVEDYPDDPDNFTVEIDASTMKVTESVKKRKSKNDFKGLDDPKTRSKKIDQAL